MAFSLKDSFLLSFLSCVLSALPGLVPAGSAAALGHSRPGAVPQSHSQLHPRLHYCCGSLWHYKWVMLWCLIIWSTACEQNYFQKFCIKMINSRNVPPPSPPPLLFFLFRQKTICEPFVCDVGRLGEHLDTGIPTFISFLFCLKVVLSLAFPFVSSLQTWIPSSKPPSGLMMFGQRGEVMSSSCWWETKLTWQTRGNRGELVALLPWPGITGNWLT